MKLGGSEWAEKILLQVQPGACTHQATMHPPGPKEKAPWSNLAPTLMFNGDLFSFPFSCT